MTTKIELLRTVSRHCHDCADNNVDIANCTFWTCALRDLRPKYKSLWRYKKQQEMMHKSTEGMNTPPAYKLNDTEIETQLERPVSKKHILSMIRKHCLFCMGDQIQAVNKCVSTDCELYPYRMGKDPSPNPERVAMGKRLAEKYGFKKKE